MKQCFLNLHKDKIIAGTSMKITFEHVNKYFGDVHALEDINLTIEDGELFFLLGPSGCGKTTFI